MYFFIKFWLVLRELIRQIRYSVFVVFFSFYYLFLFIILSKKRKVLLLNRFIYGKKTHFYKDDYKFLKIVDSSNLRNKGRYYHIIGTLHITRVKLVQDIIPRVDTIVDLGGASGVLEDGALYHFGYPHHTKKLIIVDLPFNEKQTNFKSAEKRAKISDSIFSDDIEFYYTDMSDLSKIPDNSIDMVWSGESIEHITEEKSHAVYDEVYRILKPGGFFCLDTPNGLVIRLFRPDAFLDPDHKIEYKPQNLIDNITRHKLNFIEGSGLVPLPYSIKYKKFIKEEAFRSVNKFSENIDEGMIMYLKFKK
ncbi:MAG: class I SAM-dependent methyltransferase [Spirochaetes bacterium]|nr:class I SAM-dependent methyltransferase [Spirochaetota bacterium]